MAIQFQDSIHVNNGSLVATNFIAVKGNSNPDISEFNNPASTSVNLGTYLDQYAFIDLSSSASGGGWIDFSKADGSDYSGRIRYQNNTDELQVFTSGRLVTTIKSDGVGSGSWGHAKIYMSNRWGGGGTHYPTIGSEDGSAGSLIMLDNPHVPWSTENSASSSYDGRAGLRLERPDKNGWWDAGLAGDFYHIYRGGTGELLKLTSTGNLTVSGSVSATGGNSGQWNTAYGWGNHAGLYLGISDKAADSNLLDGLDSSQFLRSDAADTHTSTLTVNGQFIFNSSTNSDYREGIRLNRSTSNWGGAVFGGVRDSISGITEAWWVARNPYKDFVISYGTSSNSGGLYLPHNSNSLQYKGNRIWNASDFANNSSNWNTAYGWGNHASAGYANQNHKYHRFNNGEEYYDGYGQNNYLRMFTETATFDTFRFRSYSDVETSPDGTEWTAAPSLNLDPLLDGREDTGISLTHEFSKFRFTINRASGWPTTALFVMQSSWTNTNGYNCEVILETLNGSTWEVKDQWTYGSYERGIDLHVTSQTHDGRGTMRVTILMDWNDATHDYHALRRIMFLSNFSGGETLDPWSWNYNKVVNFDALPQSAGLNLATQSWVASQGYITSETDSQTLSWNGSNGQLTISNGNTVDLDGRYEDAGAADAVNTRIDEEILPAIDTKVSKAGDQVTGALSVGGSAAYDSTNLALDVQGNMGIWGSNKLYFKITSDNYNSWSTSQYANGSQHKFNAQSFSFTNEGYSAAVFMNINSSGVGMSRNLVLGNEVYGSLTAYGNWGAKLLFNGSDAGALNDYYIGTNGEDYNGNYSKLDLRWHTGIRMGAHPNYGGIRFFDNEDLNTRIMSIGETDANVRIDNNLWIGGAGGWITDLLNAKLGATAKATSANLVVSTAASGSVLMKHSNSEANAWIFQEAAANWGLYWFNTGSQSGQSIGNRYTTVGAEMFGFKDGNSQSAIQAPQGWDGVDANTHYQWMISNYTGSAYFNNDVESRTGFYVNGNKVATESYAAGAADAVNVRIDEEVFPAIDAAVSNLVDSAPSALNTLNELAAALGDDVNFSTTVTNSLASKLSTTGKAADSNLFDGIDSVNFVYGNANGTNDSVTTDADGLNKTGYYTSSAFTTRPSSVANWMYIEHIKLYNSNTRYQKQIGYDTYDNRMWVRTKNDNTWSGWSQIWTSDVFTNNSTDWNTAYGWGNHAGLYDAVGSADAVNIRIEEEVLPLIDTKADASHTHDYLPLSGGTITGDLSIANSRALNLFSEGTDAFVNIDARDNGEGARLHKYNRNAANTSYLPYYENWYDGNSYHSIGIEADKWRFSDSVVINQNLQVGDGMWVNGNNQAVYNDYNENLRLPPAGNNVSVIAFRATGEGGQPSSSILGYSDRHEVRINSAWKQRIYSDGIYYSSQVHVDGQGNSGQWNTAYGWGNHASAGYATLSGANSFSNSYNEFGNGVGSVSNDGNWNARLNVAGSSHARLDVKSVSDGIITTMYSHTGHGVGKLGTYSNHPAALIVNGTSQVIVGTDGSLSPVNDRAQLLGLDSNRWQIVFCEILDSAGLHEKNLQNPKGEKQVGEYETGTVLVWKGGKNVPCTEPADHMRMGIAVKDVSSPLVQGAEPVLCTGEVNEGDYLVTSSVEGHAAAISPQYMRQHGLYDCVIGKALESAEGKSHLVKTWVNI